MPFNWQCSTLPEGSPPLALKMGGVVVAPQQYPIKTRDRAHVSPMINCQNVYRRYKGNVEIERKCYRLLSRPASRRKFQKYLLVYYSRLTSRLSTSQSKARLTRNIIFNQHEQYSGRELRNPRPSFYRKKVISKSEAYRNSPSQSPGRFRVSEKEGIEEAADRNGVQWQAGLLGRLTRC